MECTGCASEFSESVCRLLCYVTSYLSTVSLILHKCNNAIKSIKEHFLDYFRLNKSSVGVGEFCRLTKAKINI